MKGIAVQRPKVSAPRSASITSASSIPKWRQWPSRSEQNPEQSGGKTDPSPSINENANLSASYTHPRTGLITSRFSGSA